MHNLHRTKPDEQCLILLMRTYCVHQNIHTDKCCIYKTDCTKISKAHLYKVHIHSCTSRLCLILSFHEGLAPEWKAFNIQHLVGFVISQVLKKRIYYNYYSLIIAPSSGFVT